MPVVIGAIYNITGQQRVLDIPSANGAQLAARQANASGGILQRPLQLVVEDGQSDIAVTAEKTRALLASHHGVAALMGASDTDLVLPAAKVAAAAGRLFLTSGATSPRLPAEVPEYLYLACFGDNVQAAAAAQWGYRTLKAKTASIVYDSEKTYTQLLQGYFREQFESSLGGSVNAVSSYKVSEMQAISSGVQPADVIFLAAEQAEDAARAVRILRAGGLTAPILGGDGYDAPGVWAQYPDVSEVYFTTHAYLGADNPNPAVTRFIEAYRAAYPGQEPDSFAGLGFDAVGLLVDAISRAGTDAPGEVREALAATEGYKGVTGTISFTGGSRIPRKSVALVGVDSGKFRLIEEILPDSVPMP